MHKRIESISQLATNKRCADCKTRISAGWASAKLGVFICIDCSSIHRNMGTHISFVRSVTLDNWTKEQVDFMEEWGNERANQYYEASIPANYKIYAWDRFVRDKYEFKRFVKPPPIHLPPVDTTSKLTISRPNQSVLPPPVIEEVDLIDFSESLSSSPIIEFQDFQMPVSPPPPVPSVTPINKIDQIMSLFSTTNYYYPTR